MGPRLLMGCLVLAASALALGQPTVPVRLPEVGFKLVGGRIVLKGRLVVGSHSVEVHVLLDLGGSYAFKLHENTAGLLRWKPGALLSFETGAHGFGGIDPEVQRLSSLESLTAAFATELEEIPIAGVLGALAFGAHRIDLDYARGILRVAQPESEPPRASVKKPEVGRGGVLGVGAEVEILGERRPGALRLRLDTADGQVLIAALGTAHEDTWIDRGTSRALGHPGGDLSRALLGPVDVACYVAFRPGDAPSSLEGPPDVILGNRFLSHFRVVVDSSRRTILLSAVREPTFPLDEQTVFRCMEARDASSLESFLATASGHRLSRDAGRALLDIRLSETPAAPADVRRAVSLVARSTPKSRRARALLDLVATAKLDAHPLRAVLAKVALELALEAAEGDEDADAGHRIRSEIGGLLLDEGDARGAYRQLLAAAFGLPRDGFVNLRLGRYYEARDKPARAWSRYLMAAITEEAGPEGLTALHRLAEQSGARTPYAVDDLERALEGRFPVFEPASSFQPRSGRKPTRFVLAELVTGAHEASCLAAALACDGLSSHFRGGELLLLEHHVDVPRADPLASPASLARAKELEVSVVPTVILDGLDPVTEISGARTEMAATSFRRLCRAVESRLEQGTPWKLEVLGMLGEDQDLLRARVTIAGPFRPDITLRVYVAERSVIFPGAAKVVFHRYVTRHELTDGGIPLEPKGDLQEITRSTRLSEITKALLARLTSIASTSGHAFPPRPVDIEPRQLVLVAFLEDGSGHVLQAASWEAAPKERH